jgi:Spy/CpxP family protein refolding chaperone
MRALYQSVFALGLAALITVPALAQEKLGGRPADGRDRAAGIPGEPPGGGAAGLVVNKSVQKELKLTAEQVKDLPPAIRKVREKHQADLAQLRDLEPDKQVALMKTVADESMKAIAEILKPEQTKRLKQIDRQQWVFAYVISAEVAKDLKLTDDQKDKVKNVCKEYTQEVTRLAVGSGRPFDQESHEKLTKASLAAFVEVLTDDQRKTWKELIGEPFELKADPAPFLVGNVRLFSDQRVRKELNLTEEQRKRIQDGLEQVQEKYREEIGKVAGRIPGAPAVPGAGGGLDPEQFAALTKNVREENQKVIAGVLKPEQAKRLKQLELQFLGINIVESEEVVKALDLTADQKRQMKALVEDFFSDSGKLSSQPRRDPAETRKLVEAHQKLFRDAVERIPSLLTPEQRKVWRELTGEPFYPEPADNPKAKKGPAKKDVPG